MRRHYNKLTCAAGKTAINYSLIRYTFYLLICHIFHDNLKFPKLTEHINRGIMYVVKRITVVIVETSVDNMKYSIYLFCICICDFCNKTLIRLYPLILCVFFFQLYQKTIFVHRRNKAFGNIIHAWHDFYYSDVTWAPWRLNSPATRLFLRAGSA